MHVVFPIKLSLELVVLGRQHIGLREEIELFWILPEHPHKSIAKLFLIADGRDAGELRDSLVWFELCEHLSHDPAVYPAHVEVWRQDMLHARLAQVVLLGTWRRRKQAYVVCTRAEVQLFGDGLHERILGVQQTEEQLSGPRPPLFLLLSFDLYLTYFV